MPKNDALAQRFNAGNAISKYQFESGQKKWVRLPEPLATLYEHCGFIPTVASVPLVGVLCIAGYYRRYRQLTKETEENDAP